ncbi:F-box protein At2g17036-like [Cornus florida]|uniref:F-box protein At2g17036-like n=1 Tax=Cornus florida TaxID=4283 RepID=UPI002898947E|nr:F-box protein At2g17036-like [Cornus florida]
MVFDMNSLVESDWAWLPKNLLDVIMDKLNSQSDCVRFGAVCKPWRFVAMENKVKYVKNKCYTQVPLLMVPTKDNSEERRSLYNITHNKIYDFQLRVPYKKRCCGSSYGWLFTVEENMGVTLLNPFSGSTIGLPPIKDPPKEEEEDEDDIAISNEPPRFEYLVSKAILSADPTLSPDDYIVTASMMIAAVWHSFNLVTKLGLI